MALAGTVKLRVIPVAAAASSAMPRARRGARARRVALRSVADSMLDDFGTHSSSRELRRNRHPSRCTKSVARRALLLTSGTSDAC